jgi:hypothetical protein
MRGRKLAIQAGFFCVPANGFSIYKRRLAFSVPRKGVTPAQVVCSTAVMCGPLSIPLFANVEHIHHAPRPFPTCHHAVIRVTISTDFLSNN